MPYGYKIPDKSHPWRNRLYLEKKDMKNKMDRDLKYDPETNQLFIDLCEIDPGRFDDVIHALDGICKHCKKCAYFNLSLPNIGLNLYRCRVAGSCPAATLHPELVSYFNWKLGWISEKDHLNKLGLIP